MQKAEPSRLLLIGGILMFVTAALYLTSAALNIFAGYTSVGLALLAVLRNLLLWKLPWVLLGLFALLRRPRGVGMIISACIYMALGICNIVNAVLEAIRYHAAIFLADYSLYAELLIAAAFLVLVLTSRKHAKAVYPFSFIPAGVMVLEFLYALTAVLLAILGVGWGYSINLSFLADLVRTAGLLLLGLWYFRDTLAARRGRSAQRTPQYPQYPQYSQQPQYPQYPQYRQYPQNPQYPQNQQYYR